ncbi:hypothetical protein Q3G72_005190 [Acer saccharum]|nr:hypothetical protein Q3G72_005190 [Acer saccharum]
MNLFKEWIRNPLDGGCLLGLCIHDKAVHLAVSGPDNVNAVPISASQHCSAIPIPREEYYKDLMVDKFQTLISEYNLIGFVVEYPYKGSDLCRYTYWEESIATEVMDFVVDHHVEFVLENLKPDLESKSKQIVKDFVIKKFVAARLLQGYLDCANTTVAIENYKVAERGVHENVNASVNTFPRDMPEAEIEEKLQKRREELMDMYMASFVLQGFVDYGRLSSDKDRKGKMAVSVPVIRLLSV